MPALGWVFKVGPQIMIYGKAGYTNARATVSYTFGATTGTVSDNLDGYRLGAGVQYTQGHMFGRLEYRYSDYGDFRFEGVSTGIDRAAPGCRDGGLPLLIHYRMRRSPHSGCGSASDGGAVCVWERCCHCDPDPSGGLPTARPNDLRGPPSTC